MPLPSCPSQMHMSLVLGSTNLTSKNVCALPFHILVVHIPIQLQFRRSVVQSSIGIHCLRNVALKSRSSTREIVSDASREKLPNMEEVETTTSNQGGSGIRGQGELERLPLLQHSPHVTGTRCNTSLVIIRPDMSNDSFLFGEQPSNPLSPELLHEIQERFSEAVIKCSERCLYQSAKW